MKSLRQSLFHLAFLFLRPMTLGVRALAFDAEGRVLLVRHTYIDGWHLCGGGVEPGQTLEEAAIRELVEEANVVPGDVPQLLSVHLNRSATKRDHVALFLFTNVRQTADKKRDREIAEARFFALDDLPPDAVSHVHSRLAEYLNRSRPDPYWT